MSIFELLKKDHREAKAALKKIENLESAQSAERKHMYAKVSAALEAHSRSEEKAVYDVVKDMPKTHEMVMEGFEEHHVLDRLMEELSETDPAEDAWLAKITVLREILEHHIEEEEDDLFKKIKKACLAIQLKQMEIDFKELKTEEMAKV